MADLDQELGFVADDGVGFKPDPAANPEQLAIQNYDKLQAHYGTLPQQVLTGAEEGLAKGFAGPLTQLVRSAYYLRPGFRVSRHKNKNLGRLRIR